MIPLAREQISEEVAARMEALARKLGGSWRVESPDGNPALGFPFIVLTEEEAAGLAARSGPVPLFPDYPFRTPEATPAREVEEVCVRWGFAGAIGGATFEAFNRKWNETVD